MPRSTHQQILWSLLALWLGVVFLSAAYSGGHAVDHPPALVAVFDADETSLPELEEDDSGLLFTSRLLVGTLAAGCVLWPALLYPPQRKVTGFAIRAPPRLWG